MDALDLARWQFGIVTVYHFLFVPITIGMGVLVAGLQTAWYRTGNEKWLRLTKFYGKIFLVNLAMGVVTGIVQEFQFGMNWSDYSRFVGDIFGAPLAIEALLAFFVESTFIGLWIFGWDRLPPKLHLATIWAVAIGAPVSAFFILAANSWMQNPTGFRIDEEQGRAELENFADVLTNKVLLVTFPHTIAGAMLTGGAVVAAVAMWHLIRRPGVDTEPFRSALRLGAWTIVASAVAVVVTGDIQGKIMTQVQPMKMAAAEGLYETETRAGFSLLTIGTLDGSEEVFAIKVPGLLSYLGHGDFNAEVEGINDLQTEYEDEFGAGENYKPNIPITYWTFRLMIATGVIAGLVGAWFLWLTRKGGAPTSRWVLRAAVVLPLLPLAANAFGWIFTEMGRQPWLVFSLMPTAAGVSPETTAGEVITSLSVFSVLYGVLAVIEVGLLIMVIRNGLPDVSADVVAPTDDPDKPMAFAY
jgi:cytochrome bd ubiquinol oxidase subunit I